MCDGLSSRGRREPPLRSEREARELNLSGAHAGERGARGERREIKKEIVSSRCFKLPFITTHKPKEPRRSSLARKERKVLGLYSSGHLARPRTTPSARTYTLFYIIESHLRLFLSSLFSLHFPPFLPRSPHCSAPYNVPPPTGCGPRARRRGADLGNDHYLRYSDK